MARRSVQIAEAYRRNAADCDALARNAADEKQREQIKSIADTWRALADQRERLGPNAR